MESAASVDIQLTADFTGEYTDIHAVSFIKITSCWVCISLFNKGLSHPQVSVKETLRQTKLYPACLPAHRKPFAGGNVTYRRQQRTTKRP